MYRYLHMKQIPVAIWFKFFLKKISINLNEIGFKIFSIQCPFSFKKITKIVTLYGYSF